MQLELAGGVLVSLSNLPVTVDVYGYSGNGVVEGADGSAGIWLGRFSISATFQQSIAFDTAAVTNINSLLAENTGWLGFGIDIVPDSTDIRPWYGFDAVSSEFAVSKISVANVNDAPTAR